ncbi:DegT/DnrJ/EryC1/StrS family aminotransferase [candidate division WOR-3 bacterium]|nr:DegT/DnrJ/EryC1/StrS family aminotransferase [candidate division WOR-3 bacterium]
MASSFSHLAWLELGLGHGILPRGHQNPPVRHRYREPAVHGRFPRRPGPGPCLGPVRAWQQTGGIRDRARGLLRGRPGNRREERNRRHSPHAQSPRHRPRREVVTSTFTFFASVEAIMQVGARPVFADIDQKTLCLLPGSCAAAFTPATKAVLLVHVFGHCADLERFHSLCEENNLALVENAAQAIGGEWHGRRLGSLGRGGAISFHPTKNLSALGDAGAVVTSDSELAERLRQLRSHGRDGTGRHAYLGTNSHLDELQAAFLRLKLGKLDAEPARRRELAVRYNAGLPRDVRIADGAEGGISSYHQDAIRTDRRDALKQFLLERGIGTGDYYPAPAHSEPAAAAAGPFPLLPETERACKEVLTLPVRPSLTDEQQKTVVDTVRRFFAGV